MHIMCVCGVHVCKCVVCVWMYVYVCVSDVCVCVLVVCEYVCDVCGVCMCVVCESTVIRLPEDNFAESALSRHHGE